jgi:glycerol kinase
MLILAIDQGTTGTTCLLLDAAHRSVAKAYREFPQIYPKEAWVEHDPEVIWATVLATIADLFSQLPGRRDEVAVIGITNQRETSLLWDRQSGAALANAIVWQCRRSAPLCATLKAAGHEPEFRRRTGLVLDPYFSGTKLRWMLDNHPGAAARAEAGELAFGTIDTWLIHKLTGGAVHATDTTNASRTLMANIDSGGWDPVCLDILGVPAAILPEIRACDAYFGSTDGVEGLADGIPIHGVLGDQHAALFGQACFAPGDAKCTYGTGAFLLANTGEKPVFSSRGLLTTPAWRLGGQTTYALEGATFIAGAAVQWLRDGLGMIDSAAQIEGLAGAVSDSGGVTFVPALAGLGAPHWRPEARGAFFGISRATGRAHIARAVLDGIALQVVDLLDAMAADSGLAIESLRVDGGAAANDLLMQTQADLFGVAVDRPPMLEATGLGAGLVAGLGAGIFAGLADISASWRLERRFEVGRDQPWRRAQKERWDACVSRC